MEIDSKMTLHESCRFDRKLRLHVRTRAGVGGTTLLDHSTNEVESSDVGHLKRIEKIPDFILIGRPCPYLPYFSESKKTVPFPQFAVRGSAMEQLILLFG